MASGRALRMSRHFVTAAKVFEGLYAKTGGTYTPGIWGIGVMASLDGDAKVEELFRAPPEIPGGTTPKIQAFMLADATSGLAKIEPAWRAVGPDTDLTNVNLSTEGLTPTLRTGGGASDTMQWEAGDNVRALLASWTMDATTAPTLNQLILVTWNFRTSGWTLAVPLVLVTDIIWE